MTSFGIHSIWTLRFSILLGGALWLVGCGSNSPSTEPAGTGGTQQEGLCETDGDCDDGVTCNGSETCEPNSDSANAEGCVRGIDIECDDSLVCSEVTGECESACDVDADGHESAACGGDDCDDENNSRYPGNEEACTDEEGELIPGASDRDEDCDPNTLGSDQDDDSYYDSRCSNVQSDGEEEFGLDCDDANDLKRPGFQEICDGLDNDCNGELDYEGEDDDGDGFADCADLEGLSGFDCDDEESTTFPGAEETHCDAVDSDCDGNEESLCPIASFHGAAFCEGASGCGIECDEGRADCDGSVETGCETSILSSSSHCGACGETCPFGCVEGACTTLLALDAGSTHVCALTEHGVVYCWGNNSSGQLGNGSEELEYHVPVRASGLAGVATAVAAGGRHTCAIVGGDVKCWGSDEFGQLGDGDDGQAAESLPVDVIDLPADAALITTGQNHTCAALVDGSIYCWGADDRGQIGDGDDGLGSGPENPNGQANKFTPVVAVAPGSSVVALGAHWDTTCATFANGSMQCWGWGAWGQLGNGVTPDGGYNAYAPVTVTGLSGGPTDVSSGFAVTCALTDGDVKCWGDNRGGGLGIGSSDDDEHSQPANAVLLDESALDVDTGGSHNCAVLTTGEVQCWGADYAGQLGNGVLLTADQATPVLVTGLVGEAQLVAAGDSFSCALLKTGNVQCWGADSHGQLGDGPDAGQDEHLAVQVAPATESSAVVGVDGGWRYNCAWKDNGTAQCWGADFYGVIGDGEDGQGQHDEPGPELEFDEDILAIGTGAYHACALLSSGDVECWGFNNFGQVGNGVESPDHTDYSYAPTPVLGLDGFAVQVVGGDVHSCALLSDGRAMCWGNDNGGALGDGTDGNQPHSTAQPVLLDHPAIQLSAGRNFTCALLLSQEVACWGTNDMGELGLGDTTSRDAPEIVPGLEGVTQIASSGQHTCALLDDESVVCWGSDVEESLGDGDDSDDYQFSPVAVVGLSGPVASVDVGFAHCCALLNDGSVECWGADSVGTLGDGEDDGAPEAEPVSVTLPGPASEIGLGTASSCALLADSSVMCWGEDSNGAVGDGSANQDPKSAPVLVIGL